MEIITDRIATGYRMRILLGTLFAAVVADGLITRFLISNGFAREANPFLTYWVGRDVFLALKLVGGFLAVTYLFFMYRRRPRLSFCIAAFFLAAYTIIVFWNLALAGWPSTSLIAHLFFRK